MRRHLEPGPDHPISIESKASPVRIFLAGEPVLASRTHLELREASYAPALYLPRSELDLSYLVRSEHTSWCPYKGEASYFHLRRTDGTLSENAVWTYETPFPAVAEIKAALAVYGDRVDAIEVG
nr:DUF427 domain-containing protein [Hyphomonas sp. Mor2]